MGNAKKCLKRFLNLQKDVSSDTCYPILAIWNLVSETQYLKLATPCKILLPFATIVRLAIFLPESPNHHPSPFHYLSCFLSTSPLESVQWSLKVKKGDKWENSQWMLQ